MGSEVLLYGYGIVCVCMLIFNIVYNLSLRRKDKSFDRKNKKFTVLIEEQLNRLHDGEELDPKHIKLLGKKLKNVNNLISFCQVIEEENRIADASVFKLYLNQVHPVILYLATIYQKRDNMQAGYFAYFISRFSACTHMLLEAEQQILLGYLKKDSLYCRINTLEALYHFGAEEKIVEAIVLLDHQGSFIHEKILTDGLMSFTGDHKRLIGLLWQEFEDFSVKTKLSVLNYIRFKSGDFCKEMFKIMSDQSEDKELRFSAIRYFEKYHYEPAREKLLEFARDKNLENWEYTAISMTALHRYADKEVIDTLMQGIHSSNWYVRSNASASLEACNLEYSDLIEVVGGKDRYAREMMLYRLESRRL